MFQDIIAYIIVIAAFGVLVYRILQFFNVTKKKASKCGGCTTGCSLKELHIANKTKFNKNDQYSFYS